ncbi:MAG: DUF4351 domain-containing protein [Pseudomonadota bacterium]|nr:DUF4351 domain-containing protein [Pseudomonadota bacterium]
MEQPNIFKNYTPKFRYCTIAEQDYRPVLETAIAQEREKFFAQGKVEGRAEGKAEGRAEGQAELLIALLEKRFSPLTPAQKAFIYQLESSQLIALSEKLWQAQSLANIFAEQE